MQLTQYHDVISVRLTEPRNVKASHPLAAFWARDLVVVMKDAKVRVPLYGASREALELPAERELRELEAEATANSVAALSE